MSAFLLLARLLSLSSTGSQNRVLPTKIFVIVSLPETPLHRSSFSLRFLLIDSSTFNNSTTPKYSPNRSWLSFSVHRLDHIVISIHLCHLSPFPHRLHFPPAPHLTTTEESLSIVLSTPLPSTFQFLYLPEVRTSVVRLAFPITGSDSSCENSSAIIDFPRTLSNWNPPLRPLRPFSSWPPTRTPPPKCLTASQTPSWSVPA